MRHWFAGVIAASVAASAAMGCASTPIPADRMASSESAVRAAREIGAEQTPTAALHLKLAQEQIDKAKSLIRDGDNARAAWVLARAEADADLALGLAREASLRTEAQNALDRVKALRQEQQRPM